MRSFTSIDLACSWPDTARYLPRHWITTLNPYVDPDRSSILSARLLFGSEDPTLKEFLSFAEQMRVSEPGSGGLGQKGDSGPLLRTVRRWSDYSFADLQTAPVAQLLLDRIIALAPPLSRIYRVEIEPTFDCASCGQAHLRQQQSLRVRDNADPESGLRGDFWQPGDQIAVTENYEILISERLCHLWKEMAAHESPQFLPVEQVGGRQPLWQAPPQGTIRVMAPPTPLQVRDRCPTCDRPLTVALNTASSDIAFGPGRRTVYEEEALLTLNCASLPVGDLWATDLHEGRVRELTEVLQSNADNPDPFYIRSCRPFWLVSQRLLRLLHEHVPGGWRCQPVNGLSRMDRGSR